MQAAFSDCDGCVERAMRINTTDAVPNLSLPLVASRFVRTATRSHPHTHHTASPLPIRSSYLSSLSSTQ